MPSQYDPNVVYRFGGVEAHGMVDMRKALLFRQTFIFIQLAEVMATSKDWGPQELKNIFRFLAGMNKTGIDLPGEFSGFIPSPAWKKATKGQSLV